MHGTPDQSPSSELRAEIRGFDQAAADMRVSANARIAFEWEKRAGEVLRRARESLGASQSDVAAELSGWGIEMHQTTLAKLEAGKRPIRLAEMFALATLYGLTPGMVLLEAESPIPEGDDLDRRLANVEAYRAEVRDRFAESARMTFNALEASADERAALRAVINAMSATGRERWIQRNGEHQAEA